MENKNIFNPESVNKQIEEIVLKENHIESRRGKISFILDNSERYKESDLIYMNDIDVDKIYSSLEKNINLDTKSLDTSNLDNMIQEMNNIFESYDIKKLGGTKPTTSKEGNGKELPKSISQTNKVLGQSKTANTTYVKSINKEVTKVINKGAKETTKVYSTSKEIPDTGGLLVDYKYDSDMNTPNDKLTTVSPDRYIKKEDNTKNNEENFAVKPNGLTDLQLDHPNKTWEKRRKEALENGGEIGKQMYKASVERIKYKEDNNLPNTKPGRFENVKPVSKSKIVKENIVWEKYPLLKENFNFISSIDDIFSNTKKVVKFTNKNLNLLNEIDKDEKLNKKNMIKLNLLGYGNLMEDDSKTVNEFNKIIIESFDFYYDYDENKYYVEKKSSLNETNNKKINNDEIKSFNRLLNYNTKDKYDSDKNISKSYDPIKDFFSKNK